MKSNKHLGLKIGAIFSLVSILLTFTLAVPMFSVLPGFFLEQGLFQFLPSWSSEDLAILVIAILFLFALLALYFSFKWIKGKVLKNQNLKSLEIVIIMIGFYFIIHPLGFYIFWGLYLDFENDAQLIFNSVMSFPFSSITFILLGFLLDRYILKLKQFNNQIIINI